MIIKRICDICFGIFALLLLLPFFFIVCIVLTIITKGHPFFIQKRVGRNGKIFLIYKFRTLKSDTPEYVDIQTLNLIEHETKFGGLLRRFGLDELPQLINIIKGDMSFIGPRPLIPSDSINLFRHMSGVDKMRPGLSGLAQIHGGNQIDYFLKFMYDAYYVSHWSIKLDLKIIWKTILFILDSKNSV